MNDIDSFDKNISFWDALKENLFSKDWIKNSLGEIVSKDNINSYIEELDLDSAKKKLKKFLILVPKMEIRLGRIISIHLITEKSTLLMLLKVPMIYPSLQAKI